MATVERREMMVVVSNRSGGREDVSKAMAAVGGGYGLAVVVRRVSRLKLSRVVLNCPFQMDGAEVGVRLESRSSMAVGDTSAARRQGSVPVQPVKPCAAVGRPHRSLFLNTGSPFVPQFSTEPGRELFRRWRRKKRKTERVSNQKGRLPEKAKKRIDRDRIRTCEAEAI